MADISIRREHGMTVEDVKEATEKIVMAVKEEFPSLVKEIRWSSDGFRADVTGSAFSGVFQLDGAVLAIDIKLSFLARPFKGRVEKKIHSRLEEYFP